MIGAPISCVALEAQGGSIAGPPQAMEFVSIVFRRQISSMLARIIHEGSSRKRADAKRDGHSEP
jgi:hypothetical protein